MTIKKKNLFPYHNHESNVKTLTPIWEDERPACISINNIGILFINTPPQSAQAHILLPYFHNFATCKTIHGFPLNGPSTIHKKNHNSENLENDGGVDLISYLPDDILSRIIS